MPKDDWDLEVQDHAVESGDVYEGYEPQPPESLNGLGASEYGASTRRLQKGAEACEKDPGIRGRINGSKPHNVFSQNNVLRLMTFSQSRLSCSPSEWCRRNCYAGFIRLQAEAGQKTLFATNKYTTNDTEESHLANWCLSRHQGFADYIIEAVMGSAKTRRPQPMRIFSEGDFTSEENVRDWQQVARAYPQHWWTFYTRKWQFPAFHDALIALAREPNVTIEMSWDPSMPWFLDPQYAPTYAHLLKHLGLAITGLSATAVLSWQGINETAKAYGTRFVFCPKNLSKVCNEEWEGMSCRDCRWCYGVQKRPWVYYMLHGLGAGVDRGWTMDGKSVTGKELEKADKALAEEMVRAGMEPGPFRVGECFALGSKNKKAQKPKKPVLLKRSEEWLRQRGVLPDEAIPGRTDIQRIAAQVKKRRSYGR